MRTIRFIALLLAFAFMLTACASDEPESPQLAASYQVAAMEKMLAQDYIGAIAILEEGLLVVGEDDALTKLLKEAQSSLTPEATSETTPTSGDDSAFDHTSYLGLWATDGIGWEYGGMILDISLSKGTLNLAFTYAQSAPASRVAEIRAEIDPSAVSKNEISLHFDNDGWGTSGSLLLQFDGDRIHCIFSNISKASDAIWGFREGDYVLLQNDQAYHSLDYTPDMYDSLFEDETESTPICSESVSMIERGGIYYDDVEALLPISMDQIMQDISAKKVNYFYVDRNNIPFEIDHVIPIKGGYTDRFVRDEYRIDLYGCFYHNDIVYEAKFRLTYDWHEIGGWVLSGGSIVDKSEYSVSSGFEPYRIHGRKLNSFSYTDFPADSPISPGEIADDILYAEINMGYIDDVLQIFDIASIQVSHGEYWDNEFSEYLKLYVNAAFTNDQYNVDILLELQYKYYAAGGWELENDYSDSDYTCFHRAEDYEVTPKITTYSDSDFLEKTSEDYFHHCQTISKSDRTDPEGDAIHEIIYSATRNWPYLTESYDIVLTAEFVGRAWRESLSISLVDADYSKLLGTWEYKQGPEFIRINITDISMKFNGNGSHDYTDTTGKITYTYETSAWGSSPYQSGVLTEPLEISVGAFPLHSQYYHQYYHESPMCHLPGYQGADSYSNVMAIEIDPSRGVYLDTLDGKSCSYPLTKIS